MPACTVALLAVLPASASLTATSDPTANVAAPVGRDREVLAGVPGSMATSARPATVEGEQPITPPPATFDAPAGPAAAPPKSLQAATFDRARDGVWAVVIGIDDYPGRGSDLRASVNDADAMVAALAAYGVPSARTIVLRNGQASATIIRATLRWLVERAGPDATAVVFYAGHIRKLDHDTEAIVAADGQLVTDADVAWDLKRLRAKQTWIALAACYAGGFTEVMAPGRVLTGAADASSLAYESATYGRSYLGEFMVERAMRGGWAAGSVEQAFAWAQDELRRQHPRRVLVQYDQVDGEIVLGTPPAPTGPPPTAGTEQASAPPPEPAPPPQQPPAQPESPPAPEEDDGSCLLGIFGSTCDD